MNKNPWNEFDAFKPMFCDIIGYINRECRTSLKAAVFPLAEIEPFSEVDIDTEIMKMNVLIDYDDWKFTNKPMIGDTVELSDGTKFKVASVTETQNWYDLTTRSI